MNAWLQQFNELMKHPWLQLDCCSSLLVFCVLAFIGSKIQSEYFNIMSGAAILSFIIILALQLAPAPNVDIAGVTHAIFRAGLAAFVIYLLLAVACPFTVFLWRHTFLLAGQWCAQLEQEVKQWNNSRAASPVMKLCEIDPRPIAPPPPPPEPLPDEEEEVPLTAEEKLKKAEERKQEAEKRRDFRRQLAATIADKIERDITLADIEGAYRDELVQIITEV